MQEPTSIPVPALGPDARGIWLREWRAEDAASALAAGLDPVISRYRYSLPRSPDAARAWTEHASRERHDGVRLELAIIDDEAVVGSVSLTDLEHDNAMVRYWLLPAGRGRGLCSRALWLLCGWAFADLGIGRVGAFVEPDNLRSAAVLRRCGFLLEGRLRRHMTGPDGVRVDSLVYGLLPEDLIEPSP